MRILCAAAALTASACASPVLAGQGRIEAEADGIARLRVSVKGGASLLSFYIGIVELEIVGDGGRGFALEALSGPRGGTALSMERVGSTIEAVVDLGDYRFFRMGIGGVEARLYVPEGFSGSIEASVKEGKIVARDLRLDSLAASVDAGRLELEGVEARRMTLSTREASTTILRSSAERGELRSTLGPVRAEGLRGQWTVETAEGSVGLSMAAGLGPLYVSTTLGKVTLELPSGEPFLFEADTRLWTPRVDFPIQSSVVKGFPVDVKRHTGEVGSGGPLMRISTREGGIVVRRASP